MKEKRVRIFLLHRRVLAVLCTLAVAAGIFYVTLYPASRTAAATQRQLPIYSVERKDKLCSISFDAAWGDAKLRQGVYDNREASIRKIHYDRSCNQGQRCVLQRYSRVV